MSDRQRVWPAKFAEITTDEERDDETFIERVAICLDDGGRTIDEAVEIAREEMEARSEWTF